MPDPVHDEMFEIDRESFEKILIAMISPEGITTKTEIKNPLNLIKLKMYGSWMKAEGLVEESQMIDDFIKGYLEYMVSYKRQSRKETYGALTEGIKQARSLNEKFTSKPS